MNTIERQITRDRGLLFMPGSAGVFSVPDNPAVADGPTDGRLMKQMSLSAASWRIARVVLDGAVGVAAVTVAGAG